MEEFLNSISWIFAVINLIGYIFIVKKKPVGFILIMIANVFWILLNYKFGLYSQSVTLVIFTGINAWGWVEWKYKEKSK